MPARDQSRRDLAIDESRIEGRSFQGLRLDRFVATGSHFVGCDFREMSVSVMDFGVGMNRSLYEHCTFDGSKLFVQPGQAASFFDCTFEQVRLTGWETKQVDLVRCTFSGRMKGAMIWASPPAGSRMAADVPNVIEDNDFSGVADPIDFRGGVNLRRQRWPSRPVSMLLSPALEVAARAEAAIATWDEGLDKRRVLGLISFLRVAVKQGQTDILLYREALSDQVWHLFREALI